MNYFATIGTVLLGEKDRTLEVLAELEATMTEGASMAETAEFTPEPLRLIPGSSEFKVSLKDIELHQVWKF